MNARPSIEEQYKKGNDEVLQHTLMGVTGMSHIICTQMGQ